MTDFKTYYNSKFRDDINRFFSTIPDASRFHEDTENKQTFSIQYERLTPVFDHLDFLDKDGKELFAVALFLTVLTDMVCFSHFKTHYSKFRNLTRYPKFIGNCPGGCNYHYHPSDIFFAMNKGRSATEQHLVFYEKFLGAIETMKEETFLFVKEHLQTPIELYSEFGLQHELAIFLRNNYPDLTVRLEYPTPRIFNPLPQFIKKEIDIYVTTQTGQRFVIELKMPKDNGGIPKAMYHAIEDVKFLEQLRQSNIDGCYSILATSCIAFWEAPRADAGIYQYFNGQEVVIQSIDLPQLPTFLHNKGQIQLANIYQANWQDYTDSTNTNWKYYVLNV